MRDGDLAPKMIGAKEPTEDGDASRKTRVVEELPVNSEGRL